MATEPKPLISDDLLHELKETAHEQNREPSEIVEEAVSRYLASRRLASFAERMEARARAQGLCEQDVPRLLDEVRRENEARGR